MKLDLSTLAFTDDEIEKLESAPVEYSPHDMKVFEAQKKFISDLRIQQASWNKQ